VTSLKKDLIASALLLALSAAYYAATVRIPVSALSDEVGPHGLPTALAIGLAIVAIALGARALLAKPKAAASVAADDEGGEATPLRALGLLGVAALYIPMAEFLGYVPAIILLIAAVALYEGIRPSWRVLAVAAGGAALFWLLFVVLLGAPQPRGLFF
jgi:hypothetical protein